ncbi:MAG TPA: cell division protein FtsL [Smithellaceae bacterium]|nr:cell division protein FtsL [Smithellaceae bacterium]
MASSAETHVLQVARHERSAPLGQKYSTFIVVAVTLMLVALVYVGSHIRMTQMEYRIAETISLKEKLVEEQKKLKLEHAMLKSPQRIEVIARKQLQMVYPDKEQVIVLKPTGK